MSLISYRSACGWGKNLSASSVAFSPYVRIMGVIPTFSVRSGITVRSFSLWLWRRAYHFKAYIFFMSSNASSTKRLQYALYAFLTAFDWFYYASFRSLWVSYDGIIL